MGRFFCPFRNWGSKEQINAYVAFIIANKTFEPTLEDVNDSSFIHNFPLPFYRTHSYGVGIFLTDQNF
jgi:hypothetical protein